MDTRQDNVFTDPNWEQVSTAINKATGVYPNRLFHNATEKSGAVVVFRGNTKTSWALNERAVNHLYAAVIEGRLDKGIVILAAYGDRVVSQLDIGEVVELLKEDQPIRGEYGPYHWVNAKFLTGQKAELADAPF